MYFRHVFASSANAFIRLELSTKGSLWQFLCRLPIEDGAVFAFLPKVPSNWELLHFAWHINHRGELESETVDSEYRTKEAEYLAGFLAKKEGNIAIFHGTTVPPNGTVVMREGQVTTYTRVLEYPNQYSSVIPTRTEVYYVIRDPLTASELEFALRSVEHMPFIGVLTSLPQESAKRLTTRSFDEDDLRYFAQEAEAIWVSAYGGDVTLIWERSEDRAS